MNILRFYGGCACERPIGQSSRAIKKEVDFMSTSENQRDAQIGKSETYCKGYAIENGPSRDLFLKAFDLAYAKPTPLEAAFTLHNNSKVYVRLARIEHEAGSGHSFNFKGISGETTCSGYYNAKSRKGYVHIAQNR